MNRIFALSAGLAVLAASPLSAADISPRQIYQRVGPGVVLIMAVSHEGAGEMGTGSIIDAEGHILTNAHVIIQASTRSPYPVLHVYFKPAKLTGDSKLDMVNPQTAVAVSWDRDLDLALLKLEDKPAQPTVVSIGDASAVEAGDPVVAIGHPEQGGLWTLTQGVVSTIIADLGGVKGKNVFQTDASINRGNSGGPLLNGQGSMIGINTSMARKAKDGLTITSVNFSIKSNVVKDWLAKNDPDVRYTVPAPAADTQASAPAQAEVKPAETKPVEMQTTEAKPATVETPTALPQAEAPAKPAKPKILTPVQPFHAEDLIQKEIAEMEDLEKEMRGEIEKRRATLGQ